MGEAFRALGNIVRTGRTDGGKSARDRQRERNRAMRKRRRQRRQRKAQNNEPPAARVSAESNRVIAERMRERQQAETLFD